MRGGFFVLRAGRERTAASIILFPNENRWFRVYYLVNIGIHAGAQWLCAWQEFHSGSGQTLPEGRNIIMAPTMALPLPPSSNHRVLFVGVPVKIREMPELAESDALIP